MLSRILPLVALAGAGVALAVTPLKLQNNFAGADFFNGFNFNITDPPTLTDPNQGNINYVNSSVAMNGPIKLAFVNNAGNVILRVDNVTDNPNPGPFSTFGRNTADPPTLTDPNQGDIK